MEHFAGNNFVQFSFPTAAARDAFIAAENVGRREGRKVRSLTAQEFAALRGAGPASVFAEARAEKEAEKSALESAVKGGFQWFD